MFPIEIVLCGLVACCKLYATNSDNQLANHYIQGGGGFTSCNANAETLSCTQVHVPQKVQLCKQAIQLADQMSSKKPVV